MNIDKSMEIQRFIFKLKMENYSFDEKRTE